MAFCSWGDEWEYVGEPTLQTPRSVKKEGEELLQALDSPAAHGEDHGEAGFAPAARGGPWWSRSPPAAHGRPCAWAGGCPKEAVTPWRARAGAGSCQDLWPHGESSPHWSRFAGRPCDPVGDPCWSSLLLKDCTLWEGPTLGQFVKSCSLWDRPHAGAGAECEDSSPWGTRSSRDSVWWTDHNPHSLSPCAARGRRQRKSGEKLSLGRMEGWEEGVLRFNFYCSLPYFDLDW